MEKIMMFVIIALIILSVIFFNKRQIIREKFNVGYISSFLFTAYMFVLFTMIAFGRQSIETNELLFVIVCWALMIIGVAVFIILNLGNPAKYIIGKLFATLAIGLCSWVIFVSTVFKMVKGLLDAFVN